MQLLGLPLYGFRQYLTDIYVLEAGRFCLMLRGAGTSHRVRSLRNRCSLETYINFAYVNDTIEWNPLLPSILMLEAYPFEPVIYCSIAFASVLHRIELRIRNLLVLRNFIFEGYPGQDLSPSSWAEAGDSNCVMPVFPPIETEETKLSGSSWDICLILPSNFGIKIEKRGPLLFMNWNSLCISCIALKGLSFKIAGAHNAVMRNNLPKGNSYWHFAYI